jgi:hypothetical protein
VLERIAERTGRRSRVAATGTCCTARSTSPVLLGHVAVYYLSSFARKVIPLKVFPGRYGIASASVVTAFTYCVLLLTCLAASQQGLLGTRVTPDPPFRRSRHTFDERAWMGTASVRGLKGSSGRLRGAKSDQ